MIRIASIGYGRHFRRSLLPNVVAADGLTLHLVCERDATLRRQATDELPGVRVCDDPEAVFADRKIDAVLISTDPDSNLSLARRALEAGKHVFVEKPVGTSAAALTELARTADEQAVVIMTGTMWRFAPVHTVLDSWLRQRGTRVANLTICATFPEVITRRGWDMDERELAFYDMFIHAIDWSLVHVPGAKVQDVLILPPRRPHHIEASVRLLSDDGRLATLNLATASEGYQIATWMHTDRGDVAEIDTKERLRITTRPTWSGTEGWIRDRPSLHYEAGQVYRGFARKGYFEELTEFVQRVVEDRDHALGARQAAEALDVIAQCLSLSKDGPQ